MEGTPHHQRHATFDAVKDMQSPRFRAIMKATSGRKKHPPIDVKSFSHELNSKSKQQNPFRKFHGYGYSQDIMVTMRVRFKRLKEEVNSELGAFAGDLVSLLEKSSEEYPDWSRTIEDMLVVAQECAEMSLDDFWNKCEGIVQTLDDRRQELPMGPLKQIHTRMLFILTRCTRLLQFQKESMLPGNEHALRLHQFSDLGVYPGPGGLKSIANMKHVRKHLAKAAPDHEDLLASRDRISSWKKLPPAGKKSMKKEQDPNRAVPTKEFLDPLEIPEKKGHPFENSENIKEAPDMPGMDKVVSPSQIRDQVIDGGSVMICRICDLKIPKMYVEQHSRICTLADRCDLKGLNVNERLERVAEILEKILEACSPKNSSSVRASQESRGVSTSSMADESNELSFESQTSTDAMEFASETNGSIAFNYKLATVPQMLCKTECVPPVDHCAVPTSSGSVSPPSSLSTPRGTQISLLLTGRDASSELENFQQVHELLDLAHCIANTNSISYASLDYLHSCLQELQEIVEDKKVDALIVETFGRRIEKLLQEKYAFVLRQIDDGKLDVSNVAVDEDGSTEGDSVHSSRTSPLSCKLKERTTIEDFEIIKPISRGAFGRVFLAKKRVTGDLFAIKILRKADMIRKNAVESILAERNILISVRNPFVVRFFYSFTCRENLYLVMEYLNGGDLYSLLRNLGCLDENMAQIYVAEVVLALEYLHSLNVIHRDLKPDNLLIGHDGHIKLTDFGLSKVGLINSTDDLSGPDVSGSALIGDQEHEMTKTERTKKREQRQKQEVVGTPDYLAPEILLGMTHGPTADWWSVGIILFELLVGIPPFNAEHPQKIFDNIMNRDIPWPQVPEEMSSEAYDLIDKLLIENPVQRLGATGAGEVKNHPFFKDINWDMLAKQKAAFIPSTDGDDDTSYFTCRHTWNSSDVNVCMSSSECDYFSDTCSMSCCSTPLSYDLDEEGDECKNLADFGGRTHEVNYSFSNFSFKNLSQLASINYDLIRKDTEDSRNTSNCQGS